MTLLGPNAEDKRKLHAEVNQLVNQRFLLTTAAITVFGVVIAFLIPKNPPVPGGGVGAFVYLLSAMLSILMFALFVLSHLFKGMIRIYSTYLSVTGASDWESDWAQYRKSKTAYLGYTKPQAVIFLMLNAICIAFPFLFAFIFDLKLEPRSGCVTAALVGVFLEVLILGMGWWNWWDREAKAEEKWLAIKSR